VNQIFEKGLFRWKYWNHQLLYIFGVVVLMAGLPWSNFLMSLGQLILLGNWILEFNFKEKIQKLATNKLVQIVLILYLVHLIGLFWTTDFQYALKDLRIKLPLLFLPIVFSTAIQFSKKLFNQLIDLFMLFVLLITFVSLYKYLQVENIELYDKRELSVYISHIRFSLLICLALFFSLYKFYRNKKYKKVGYLILNFWFMSFLFILESFSGIVILSLILPIVIIFYAWRINNPIKRYLSLGFIGAFTISILSIIIWRISVYQFSPVPNQEMKSHSISGNAFHNDTRPSENRHQENGYYIYRNISYEEIQREWNNRSAIEFHGKDKNNNPMHITLLRFLTSKGSFKDSTAIAQLSNEEIIAIENGVANINYLKHPYISRIDKIIWEFDTYSKGLGTNGHSVASRIVYWKQSIKLINSNFWFGVGTGDIKQAFQKSYDESDYALNESFQLRSHNQYLSFWATFGLIGLVFILFSMLYPIKIALKRKDYYYLVFIAIAMLSMINEDTLETQAGVTFFAFFNSFLLFSRNYLPKTER